MLLELTDEQRQLQTMLRRVADERVAARAADIDRTAEYPQDMFNLLKELGLFGLPIKQEFGGTDSLVSACLAVEELGRVCYNTAYLLVVQWSAFGGIQSAGSPEQKERLLPGLADGTIRASISVTEAQSGSDVAGILTRADKVDGGYKLNGAKVYCTNSTVADVFIVAAKTAPSKRHAGISAFIMDRDTPGFTIGKPENKLGARGIPSCPLYFDDVFLPDSALMGAEGAGFRAIMDAFNHGRPIMGARGVGLAQGAMELAAKFVEERRAFGQKVADFQGVQWMIADMAIQTEAARGLVYRAATLADNGVVGKELAMAAAMAKCFATDTAMKVATDAVQLWGSAGISKDNPIERYFRDAKVLQIIEGTNQIQRNLIGRWTLKDLAG
jgi:alkylation response protein AidB-like acyl-CoA dehydrogenase